MNFLRFYYAAYKRRPLLTHVVETGIIMGSGDAISQFLIEKKNKETFDVFRTLRFSGIGFCLVAPMRVMWYKTLERRFPGTSLRTVVQKVIIDQLCFAPCIILALVSSVGTANGMGMDQVIGKLQESYTDILLNNWKLWPAVQICNFYFIPPHLRMTLVQCVALVWNIYLSWKSNENSADTSLESTENVAS